MNRAELVDHLVESRLAGRVATPVSSCLENSRKLVAGEADYTFGLSDWRSASYEEALAALRACGVRLGGPDGPSEDPATAPYVDPEVAADAIERQRDLLARLASSRGRVLCASGHAFALHTHYAGLVAGLVAAGCTILEPLAAEGDRLAMPDGEPCSIRYFDGVASLVLHGSLQHTHRPDFMEAMLAEVGGRQGVDLVIADHGFAGAAIEAGIPTVSIADVNDPALPLAQLRGRTDGVLVVDDGLNPAVYEPVTAALLSGFTVRPVGTNAR